MGYLVCYAVVPAVHSDMGVCHGALYCIPLDLSTMYTVHHIATAGPTGTHNRTHQQVLVLCPMSILVVMPCGAVQYSILSIPVHRMLTVLHATQLGTLGITVPHNRTYPWVVLCVVSAMPLVYSALRCLLYSMLLCTTLPLLHHPSHVVCIHRGGLLLLVSWLR